MPEFLLANGANITDDNKRQIITDWDNYLRNNPIDINDLRSLGGLFL